MRLSPDNDEAWRLWHELMARLREPVPAFAPGLHIQVVEILDAFLDLCQKPRAPRTEDWYRGLYRHLAAMLPPALKGAELKLFRLKRAQEARSGRSNNTRNDHVTAARRAFDWALDEELIERNPVGRARKPASRAEVLGKPRAGKMPSPDFCYHVVEQSRGRRTREGGTVGAGL